MPADHDAIARGSLARDSRRQPCRWQRLLVASALVALLGSCAARSARPPQMPTLRLDPGLLEPGAWNQRLRFEHGTQVRSFDALLEIDAGELRLVALAAQQEAFRLRWNGEQLEASQADWMPGDFRAEWVLDDLHLSLWPLEALQATLPKSWTLSGSDGGRVLSHLGNEVVRIESSDGQRRIDHPLQGYRLWIESRVLE